MRALLTAINSKYIHTGLGVRYVREYAKKQGHDVDLLEETINTPILSVLEKIMAQDYKVYGFSVHIWNKQFVFKLISMLRSLKPQAIIVVGGPEVSFDATNIFEEQSGINYILQGEGEIIFSDLLDCLKDSKDIPLHIAYINNGNIDLNGGATVISDLSILPFPYPDLEIVNSQHKIVYYECTRGCPFNCAYCLSGISRTVRKRPLDLVLRDVDKFIAAKVPLVKFVDRTYNLDQNYFLPMMKYLAAADTEATFHFEIKADILTEEVLTFLQTVPKGRFQLEIGIQSTNPETLKAINRKDDWEKLANNVKKLLSFKNMHIHVDLIAGLPYEDLTIFSKSFNDVYTLNADMLQLGFLKVLPGTQMRKETKKHELIFMSDTPYEILATKYMSYQDMQFLKRLENVLDQTANSGGFKHILNILINKENKNAFKFFSKLTNWWVKNGYYPQQHNNKGVAEILYKYIQDNFLSEEIEVLIEILRYDVFTSIPGWKPNWLNWQSENIFNVISEFWRDEEIVNNYLPGYKFTSWRQIHKNYPIEMFKNHFINSEEGEFYFMLDTMKNKIIAIKTSDL